MNIAYLKATYARLERERNSLDSAANCIKNEIKNLDIILLELNKTVTEFEVRKQAEEQVLP